MLRKLLAAAGVVMVVFFVIGTVGVIQEEREDMVYSQDAILELSDIRCENIGDQYKEQEAADGYSLYRIVWTLENESIYEAYAGSLYFYYSSADESSYDDVYMPEADSGRDTSELRDKIVTSDFHCCRALLLARRAGYTQASGYGAPTPGWVMPSSCIREAFALVKSFLLDR